LYKLLEEDSDDEREKQRNYTGGFGKIDELDLNDEYGSS
jgi:hypothetical protein